MQKHTKEFEKALAEVIKIDPKLAPLASTSEFPWFFESNTLPSSFEYLVKSIASQQVSGYAAKSILTRVAALFGGQFPPEDMAKASIEDLRGAGLSMRKAEYVKALAEAFNSGQLSEDGLRSSTDTEIMDNLTAIRGVGPWTAQMYLLFYLQRMDVFSPADIGVQRGFRTYEKHYTKHKVHTDNELPKSPGTTRKSLQRANVPVDLKHMEHVAAKFSPYRSAFQVLMWKLGEQNLETLDTKTKNGSLDPAKLPSTNPLMEPIQAAVLETPPESTRSASPELPESPESPSERARRYKKRKII